MGITDAIHRSVRFPTRVLRFFYKFSEQIGSGAIVFKGDL
jgi:hypothetical protein